MTKKFLSFFESKEETTKKQNQYWKEIAKATSDFIEETNKCLICSMIYSLMLKC